MKTIRYGSFETNSSSTHAIVIPKQVDEEEYSLYDSLDHNYEFGREECRLCEHWDEKLAYIYIVLKDYKEWSDYSSQEEYKNDSRKHIITAEDIKKFEKRVISIYNQVKKEKKIKVSDYEPTPKDLFDYLNETNKNNSNSKFGLYNDDFVSFFVDHTEDFDTNGFLDRVLQDDEFLKKFIFNGDSYITVGGDEYRGYNIKTIGFEYDYNDRHCVNEKGERPPKEWYKKNGCIKQKYWEKYDKEYNIETGKFLDKLKEYEKDNDVFLKGN